MAERYLVNGRGDVYVVGWLFTFENETVSTQGGKASVKATLR